MNLIEIKMVNILKELREKYYVVGVKAEFEAEGTRMEELMRLKEICLAANVALTLKIGGCEAVRDMYDARAIGVEYLVAPMVETAFSLQKYLKAINLVFPKDEQDKMEFFINIETETAYHNFEEMLEIPEIKILDGLVMGRVDFTGSMGLDRKTVNSEKVFTLTKDLLSKAKQRELTCVVGGAIAVDSLPFLRALPKETLARYETRKICFQCPQALGPAADKGITKAVEFELYWLQNKRNYYKVISEEDDKRIAMLEERFKK
ncbi:MAG: citrate lyase beta subunit [Elusimicrobia bacterium]|nr:citrate lyase beta subunit [Elusimicrobiota bacterium]